MNRLPLVDSLLQSIQHEAGMGCPADPPAHDVAGVDVNHERDIGESRPGRDVSEIRDPQHIRRWCMELTVDPVERAWRHLVADRGAHRLAPDYALEAEIAHQPLDRASGNFEPFASHLPPHLANTIDAEILGEDPHDLRLQRLVSSRTDGQPRRVAAFGIVVMIGGWGDRQNPADRLDSILPTMLVDESDHRLNGRQTLWLAPPGQNKPMPCAGFRWPAAVHGSRVPAP